MFALEVTGYLPSGGGSSIGSSSGSSGSSGSKTQGKGNCLWTPYLSRNESATIFVPIRALVVSPQNSGMIYLGTFTGLVVGINRSTFDYRWLYMNNERIDMTGLVIDPSPPYTLYTYGHPPDDVDTGIRKSCNGGQSWKILSTRPDPHQWVVSETNSSIMYATDFPSNILVASRDGGSSWNVLATPSNVYAIAIQPDDPSSILIGTGNGIYRSKDGGVTWESLSSQLSGKTISAVCYDPANSAIVYAYSLPGLFKSVDGGLKWTEISRGPGANDAILNLSVDPRNANVAYAASNDNFYKTIDGGIDWTLIGGVYDG